MSNLSVSILKSWVLTYALPFHHDQLLGWCVCGAVTLHSQTLLLRSDSQPRPHRFVCEVRIVYPILHVSTFLLSGIFIASHPQVLLQLQSALSPTARNNFMPSANIAISLFALFPGHLWTCGTAELQHRPTHNSTSDLPPPFPPALCSFLLTIN